MADEVLVEPVEEAIVRVVLNRPAKLNAISAAMRVGIVDAFDRIDATDEVRVVILQGAGERAFSVGGDMDERKQMGLAEMRRLRHQWANPYSRVEACRKPVIAAIAGYCLGGGLELALAADLRIADEGATFGLPEVTLGVIPAGGGTQRLPRIVGLGPAKRLIFTGVRIAADEARAIGLVDQVCPRGELTQTVLGLARVIAGNPPLAVSQAKRAINVGSEVAAARGLALEAECYLTCLTSPDRAQALEAYTEARKRGDGAPGRRGQQ